MAMKGGGMRLRSCRIFADGELAATAVEYAMLASLIAAVIAAIVGVLGTQVRAFFQLAVNLFP
jgi:Flp pilus assembly pilin Flp